MILKLFSSMRHFINRNSNSRITGINDRYTLSVHIFKFADFVLILAKYLESIDLLNINPYKTQFLNFQNEIFRNVLDG